MSIRTTSNSCSASAIEDQDVHNPLGTVASIDQDVPRLLPELHHRHLLSGEQSHELSEPSAAGDESHALLLLLNVTQQQPLPVRGHDRQPLMNLVAHDVPRDPVDRDAQNHRGQR
jgi:hypothetical protein